MSTTAGRLHPHQVCFVVEDVAYAVQYCETQFGWGPFFQFKATVNDASYRNWQGEKITEVALGMAGDVQVEFLRIHCGQDSTAEYQQQYGTGLQHIGISCQSREQAVGELSALGAEVNELNEYSGVRFAFMNVVTGPAMFELLEFTQNDNDSNALAAGIGAADASAQQQQPFFSLDRATIITSDLEQALAFYCAAFGWEKPADTSARLMLNDRQITVKRFLAQAGSLEFELIQPDQESDDPFSAHLRRGDHGLLSAGGIINGDVFPSNETVQGEWLDSGEKFALYDWPGGNNALQIRQRTA